MINNSILEKLEFSKVLQFITKHCITEIGKQFVLNIVPFANKSEAETEGKLVNEAKDILIKNSLPPIEYLPNLFEELSLSKIDGSILSSKKILQILDLAIISRNLFLFFKNNKELAPELFHIAENLFVDKVFENHIFKVINENGDIKDNASKNLLDIRKELNEKREELNKAVLKIIKDLSEKDLVREDYLTLRDGRVVVPIKAEHKRHIRGFIHSESSTGQTVYIEPEETLNLNNDIVSLNFAEKREIDKLLKDLTKRIGEASNILKISLNIISRFDLIFAKANYSIEVIGSFPQIENKKSFEILDARHPLLLNKIGRSKAVPLNLKIENINVVVITGPNAGGKTVVLKTIGLLCLMIQAGIHIPASADSNFHFYDLILLDIGDQQSIEDDLSTFSSHLSNIKNILENANDYSLILLDEIGTGTDPVFGSALASSILIELSKKSALTFATTHHGSLKLISNEIKKFQNAAMEFDTVELKPTYIFKQGIPGSSYAFEIAKRIGLNEKILSNALNFISTDQNKIEKILMELEAQSYQLKEKLKFYEIENNKLKESNSVYDEKLKKINAERREILKQAKDDGKNFIDDLSKRVEQIIKNLRETNAEKQVIKKSFEEIKEIKLKVDDFYKDDIDLSSKKINFELGDFAAVKDSNIVGEIIKINNEKNTTTLLSGKLKFQVKLENLLSASGIKKKLSNFVELETLQQEYRIDIRGDRVNEIELKVNKFIDSAYTSGMDRVEILHGKGTGALKKQVKEILTNHNRIKKFYYAPIEYGGEGITIVELQK